MLFTSCENGPLRLDSTFLAATSRYETNSNPLDLTSHIWQYPSSSYSMLFSRCFQDIISTSLRPLWNNFGPYVLDWITPRYRSMQDDTVQELARIVVGLQFFAVRIALPRLHFNRHWKSVPWFLVPIMTFSWAIHFSLRIPYISNRHPCCSHYWRLSFTNGSCLSTQCVVKIDIQ